MSEIQGFFRGSGVFITGATGFLGMGVVEKLLRCCPDGGPIYLLVRPKRGKEIEERLEEVTKNKVFDVIRAQKPDCFSRLVAVAGDVGEEGLGLSDADVKKLTDNVAIVFHCAATLDFEASLKPAVMINLQGTRSIVRLCLKLPKLKALVHVSSAYVNCLKSETHEQLYPAEHDPDTVISQTLKTTDEKDMEELTARLVGKHPNTYTFTKLLAEHVVSAAASKMPIAIVRPSMITAAWHEPEPGWINSSNGPSGFLQGAAKGIIRRLPVSLDLVYDYIPVDMVINEMIVAAWHVGTAKPSQVSIYHCTTSTQRPFTWSQVVPNLKRIIHNTPLKSAVWYPNLKFLPSLARYKFSAIFVHFLPAYILDTVMRLAGARPILVRLHSKVGNSLNRLQFFIFNEWKFHNDNTKALARSLNPQDKKSFDFDIGKLEWNPYFESMQLGVRKHMNKEDDRTLNAARKKNKILRVAHYSLRAMWYILAYYLACYFSGGDRFLSLLVLPLTYLFFSIL